MDVDRRTFTDGIFADFLATADGLWMLTLVRADSFHEIRCLKDLATQLKFLLGSWPGSLTQHPTMQELYERRQAALEYHRKKFEQETRNRYMQYRGT